LLTRLEPTYDEGPSPKYKRRKAIEAYCSHTSILAGEKLTLFVSTVPESKYTVEIYRMGYYNGDGGRKVKSLGPLDGKAQETPTEEDNQLMQCRWQPGFEIEIPQDWLSGVYVGKLTASQSGYESYFIFLVRDQRKADFLFQCSDMTWQAYNRWPAWRSLYDWKDNIWHTKIGPQISFDRPYALYFNTLPSDLNPLSNGSGEFLLWEFPLCYWMEKEGYDVSYISNLDTHRDGPGLLRGKGFISVGHDEYWTMEMFNHVTSARDAGVHLAFLSGNSISGIVKLRPSHSGQPDRIFGRVKDNGSEFFPNEKELMGSSSYGVGAADWICQAPDHWLYQNTGLKKGDMIPHVIGWEYHGQPVKEDPSLVILAGGNTRKKDPKTNLIEETKNRYAATIYTAAEGNFVFNAATCWWNMLLARPPGSKNPPRGVDFSNEDPIVQQITRNLFAKIRGDV
jgi:hypothetical protein